MSNKSQDFKPANEVKDLELWEKVANKHFSDLLRLFDFATGIKPPEGWGQEISLTAGEYGLTIKHTPPVQRSTWQGNRNQNQPTKKVTKEEIEEIASEYPQDLTVETRDDKPILSQTKYLAEWTTINDKARKIGMKWVSKKEGEKYGYWE